MGTWRRSTPGSATSRSTGRSSTACGRPRPSSNAGADTATPSGRTVSLSYRPPAPEGLIPALAAWPAAPAHPAPPASPWPHNPCRTNIATGHPPGADQCAGPCGRADGRSGRSRRGTPADPSHRRADGNRSAAHQSRRRRCPGPLDTEMGTVLAIPTLPGWEKLPLRDLLSREFNRFAVLESDGIAAAFGERRHGAGTTDDV